MNNKVDYVSLRVFPYTILTIFVVMPVLMLISIAAMALNTRGGYAGRNILDIMAVIYSNGIFISYIAVIAALICLYRLNDINRWFGYAWMAFALDLVAKMGVQIMEWIGTAIDSRITFRFVVAILYPLPDICIMFAVVSMLRGFMSLYDLMGSDGGVLCGRLKKNWYILQIVRIVCVIPFYVIVIAMQMNGVGLYGHVSTGMMAAFIVLLTLSIILLVYHMGLGFLVYMQTKRACQEYYIYSYNHGR